jgi:hypothetical protein
MSLRHLTVATLLVSSIVVAPAALRAQTAPTAGAAVTSEPGKVSAARVVEVSAGVTAIDKATRTVTLKGPQGNAFDVVAGDEVRNFDQIKVGDQVLVRFQQALAMAVRKGGGVRESSQNVDGMRTKAGEKPGGVVARQVTALADVIDVNPAKKTITLKGPKGNVFELDVQNPEHFKVVKKGDQVEVDYVESLAIAVVPAAKR